MAEKNRRIKMMKMKESEGLYQVVNEVIEGISDADEIIPTWVATKAMIFLQAKTMQRSHPLVYLGCHLQLRQIARTVLRQHFEPSTEETIKERSMQYLFTELQQRYPAAKVNPQDEPRYIKLDLMSEEDIEFNVSRMRIAGKALLKHADALEAWGREHLKKTA